MPAWENGQQGKNELLGDFSCQLVSFLSCVRHHSSPSSGAPTQTRLDWAPGERELSNPIHPPRALSDGLVV